MWSLRDITLGKDSTVTDTLSADPHQDFLFILAYEPDSVNENQLLYEMAKYNFTNFLVRNFEIQIDEDGGIRRMIISGFLSYDEALQYARQLFSDKMMSERLEGCRSLIISTTNLALLGTRFSYDEYEQFYEDIFLPMKVSQEKLLIQPADIEQTDAEDLETEPLETDEGEEDDDTIPQKTQKKKVEDFDFGDDFW